MGLTNEQSDLIGGSKVQVDWSGGGILSSIRRSLGYTQVEFAEKFGLSESHYRSIDQGVCPAPITVIQEILRTQDRVSTGGRELLLRLSPKIVGSVVVRKNGRFQFRNADLVTKMAAVAPLLSVSEEAAIDAILLRALTRNSKEVSNNG